MLDSSLIQSRLIKPEKSLVQFFVRLMCSPKKAIIVFDTDKPIEMMKDAPMLSIDQESSKSLLVPAVIKHFFTAPFQFLGWFFGVNDTLYMNLIASTDLVQSKSLDDAERSYFEFPFNNKSTKKSKQRAKPAFYLDFSNSSNQGVVDGRLLPPKLASSDLDIQSRLAAKISDRLSIVQNAVVSVLFLVGLSGTIARYFRKVVHRIVAESPKVYNTQFWL